MGTVNQGLSVGTIGRQAVAGLFDQAGGARAGTSKAQKGNEGGLAGRSVFLQALSGFACIPGDVQNVIDDLENHKSYVIAKDGKPGPVSEKLYNKLRAIQYGDEADPYGWVMIVE